MLQTYFVTAERKARFSAQQWTKRYSIFWRSTSIFSFHLRRGISSASFPSGFRTKTIECPSSLSYTCYMPRPFYSSWFVHPKIIWWGRVIIKLLVVQACILLCYWPKHLPQIHILDYPQTILLFKSNRPSFTPIKKQRKNYISIYFNFSEYFTSILGLSLHKLLKWGSNLNSSVAYHFLVTLFSLLKLSQSSQTTTHTSNVDMKHLHKKKIIFPEIVPNRFKNVISGLRSGAVMLIGGTVHVKNKFVHKWERSIT